MGLVVGTVDAGRLGSSDGGSKLGDSLGPAAGGVTGTPSPQVRSARVGTLGVPADRKWYRNWAVATLLRQALADIDPRYPKPDFDVAAEREKVLTAP